MFLMLESVPDRDLQFLRKDASRYATTSPKIVRISNILQYQFFEKEKITADI